MTHYRMVIESISKELRRTFNQKEWNETIAQERSYKIIQLVEQFQEKQAAKIKPWRASD
jgi:hypothetical protein